MLRKVLMLRRVAMRWQRMQHLQRNAAGAASRKHRQRRLWQGWTLKGRQSLLLVVLQPMMVVLAAAMCKLLRARALRQALMLVLSYSPWQQPRGLQQQPQQQQ